MASLSSAQCPSNCPFCNASKSINWFCMDCDELLCDDCMQVHLKVKTSNSHEIVSLKDKSYPKRDDKRPKPHQKLAPCQFHMKDYSNYCVQCHKLVCPECLVTQHKKHELAVIDTVYEDKIKKLEQFETFIEEDLIPAISRNIEYLKLASEWYGQKFETERNKINKQDKFLKQKITDFTKKILTQLMEEFYKKGCDIFSEKKKLEKELLELNEELSSLKNLKIEHSLQDLFSKIPKNMNNFVKQSSICIEYTHLVPQFSSEELIGKKISELFGSLRTSVLEAKIDFELKETISCALFFKKGSSLAVEENGTIWIGTENGLMKKESNKMQKVQRVRGGIVDMACSKSGELLFALGNDNTLRKVNGNKVETVYKIPEEYASASIFSVHVGNDGKISLLYKYKKLVLPHFFSRLCVNKFNLQLLSAKGRSIKTICLPNIDVFNNYNVLRVAKSIDGSFYISDFNWSRVTSIDSEGYHKWTCLTPNKPYDVMTTAHGNVIIVDQSLYLQILNSDGYHLQTVYILDFCIFFPIKSLRHRNNGSLACLSENGDVYIFEIKHKLMPSNNPVLKNVKHL